MAEKVLVIVGTRKGAFVMESAPARTEWNVRGPYLEGQNVMHGRVEEPGVVYAGVEPAALFRSTDDGATWTFVEALNDHPSRPLWNPGAGGLCLHTIVLDPVDLNRI